MCKEERIIELLEGLNTKIDRILELTEKFHSKEYQEAEDIKAFAINLPADIMVEYKSNELSRLVKNIRL